MHLIAVEAHCHISPVVIVVVVKVNRLPQAQHTVLNVFPFPASHFDIVVSKEADVSATRREYDAFAAVVSFKNVILIKSPLLSLRRESDFLLHSAECHPLLAISEAEVVSIEPNLRFVEFPRTAELAHGSILLVVVVDRHDNSDAHAIAVGVGNGCRTLDSTVLDFNHRVVAQLIHSVFHACVCTIYIQTVVDVVGTVVFTNTRQQRRLVAPVQNRASLAWTVGSTLRSGEGIRSGDKEMAVAKQFDRHELLVGLSVTPCLDIQLYGVLCILLILAVAYSELCRRLRSFRQILGLVVVIAVAGHEAQASECDEK